MFEVIYHYREEVAKGEYKDEVKQRTVKIGKNFEEIDLDILAGKIMAQLARRNILIVDVEIYEFVKKKLSYREAADGFLIKNRKFRFDDGAAVDSEPAEQIQQSDAEDQLAALLAANPSLMEKVRPRAPAPQKNIAPRPIQPTTLAGQRPKRHEVFDPILPKIAEAQQKGLKFTQGKTYPIFSEESMEGTGIVIYTTVDDSGKEVRVTSEYFELPTRRELKFENEVKEVSPAAEIDLWGNTTVEQDMPDIR
jgi:hypothetical protein